jgi:hypothetical protein
MGKDLRQEGILSTKEKEKEKLGSLVLKEYKKETMK